MPVIRSITENRSSSVASRPVDAWCQLDAVEEIVSFELYGTCLVFREGRAFAKAYPHVIDRERGELALQLESLTADRSRPELQPGDRLVRGR